MTRVLVAEDDPDTAASVKVTLEEHLGATVDLVTNGALVLDHLTATRPDLLILDVAMPGLNGIDVFDLIRGSGRSGDVPVLFLTAAPEKAKKVFDHCGIRDVMGKPFNGDELARRVEALVRPTEKVA